MLKDRRKRVRNREREKKRLIVYEFLVSFRLGGSLRLDWLPTCSDSRPVRVVYVRPRLLSRSGHACNDSKFRSPSDSIKCRPRIDRSRGAKRSAGEYRAPRERTRRAQADSASDRLFFIYEHTWREGVCCHDVNPSVHRIPHVGNKKQNMS